MQESPAKCVWVIGYLSMHVPSVGGGWMRFIRGCVSFGRRRRQCEGCISWVPPLLELERKRGGGRSCCCFSLEAKAAMDDPAAT